MFYKGFVSLAGADDWGDVMLDVISEFAGQTVMMLLTTTEAGRGSDMQSHVRANAVHHFNQFILPKLDNATLTLILWHMF